MRAILNARYTGSMKISMSRQYYNCSDSTQAVVWFNIAFKFSLYN